MSTICVITDNEYIYHEFRKIIKYEKYKNDKFEFFYSSNNEMLKNKYLKSDDFKAISVKEKELFFWAKYNLIISLHCKQIFPSAMVKGNRCINVHPGFNPYNRGWFPQVFSIINKMPCGVTIHEMDEELDHGRIIYQKRIEILPYETNQDIYKKIQNLEIKLLRKHLRELIDAAYQVRDAEEGNINFKKDFDKLCKIDMNKQATYGEVIDYLRAMTFSGYDNAYFLDESGNKIFVSLKLKRDINKER